ncbi:hypothetical protein [Pseudoteredinibacter isoporae]|uniref:hypothetical protein n=1 Tax=Pseudoteredinibacter isoporae TaxID=570281 RepID=UPI003101CEED
MAYIDVRIPQMYRRLMYSALAVSWVTGVAFFILSRFVTVEGEFGPEKHPWQFPALMVHGAAAFVVMMAYGAVLMNHVSATWRLKRLRGFGLTLVAVLLFQIISAYLLYYLSSDEIRGLFANAHALVGLSFPLILSIHIITGRRERAQMQAQLEARRAARREEQAQAA